MKVIILAGGFGTRLSEYTDVTPKPMVEVGGHPILWHVMNLYAHYGHKDFYIALGYKGDVIKDHFLNYYAMNSDFTVDLSTGTVAAHEKRTVDWKVTLVDTGLHSMTGGRVKRIQPYIGNETCLLTYGDGVANVDIHALVEFHRHHGKMATVTAVHPKARFGELEIEGQRVVAFKEKPQLKEGWINGGFFVVEPAFFDLIEGASTILEKEPLEQAAAVGELMTYQHDGFWQCMDTVRDRNVLSELWESGSPPWKVWE
ncbi:MAG: glucose-1-phosphate cytidylyltransferase [Planctomycetes bacterium]|nr:glucose-1-phosphate cytidylyltransferase [Planctomycetota bacterium]